MIRQIRGFVMFLRVGWKLARSRRGVYVTMNDGSVEEWRLGEQFDLEETPGPARPIATTPVDGEWFPTEDLPGSPEICPPEWPGDGSER